MSSLPDYPLTTASLKVVIDTNILLVSISSRSSYHPIWRSFIDELYTLCGTTDILYEYEEILSQPWHLNMEVSRFVLETIDNAPNVIFVTPYYHWGLIMVNPDDNKFVDCAIACNADYIVTHDGHFDALNTSSFPQINIITADEFLAILSSLAS